MNVCILNGWIKMFVRVHDDNDDDDGTRFYAAESGPFNDRHSSPESTSIVTTGILLFPFIYGFFMFPLPFCIGFVPFTEFISCVCCVFDVTERRCRRR